MHTREPQVGFRARVFAVLRWLTPALLIIVPSGVLLGWQLHIEIFKTVLPGFVAMNPLTAIFFILIGLTIIILLQGSTHPLLKGWTYVVVAVVFTGGLVIFLRSVVGYDSRGDLLLFSDRLGTNRMAPNTALSFMLVAVGVLFFSIRSRWSLWVVRVAYVLVTSLAFIALVGYVLGIRPLYGVSSFIPMALHTATLFVLIAITMLAATLRIKMQVSRKILTGLAAIILVMVAIVSLIISNMNEAERLQTQGAETSDFTIKLEEAVAKVTDAETSQRGYVLTGNDLFLEPYARAHDVRTDVERLLSHHNLTIAQTEALRQLLQLVDEKMTLIDETIILRRDKGFETARSVVASQRGRLISEDIRTVSSRIRQTALDDLAAATAAQQAANARSLSTILLGAALMMVTLGAVYLMMVRENSLRSIAERRLRHEKNDAEAAEAKAGRLAAIVESSEEAIISEALDGRILTWNHGAEVLYGYTAREVVGKSAAMLAPPGHQHEVNKFMERIKAGERVLHFETVRVRKDKKVINVALTISPISNQHNNLIGASLVARDTTAQKRFEKALEESNRRFELASKATNDAIYDLDLATSEIKWGEGIIALFGYENPASLGDVDHWLARIHPDDAPAINQSLERAIKGKGYHWTSMYRFQRADDTYAYVQDRAFIVRDPSGKAIRIIGSVMDVTHQKELEHAKDEFLSIASHQLRTPLTSIRLFSEMLAKGQAGELNEQQRDYATKINQSTDRMVRLVGDILNISRIQMGRLKVVPQEQHIEDIVEQSVAELQPLAAQKGLYLKFKKSRLPPLMVDRVLMEQIIHNLLTNAMRYTNSGGVTVTLKRSDKGAYIIEVIDTGIGIPKAAQAKIFERFFRAVNAIRQEGEGTGLGLYLIKMIMDTTGGKVWFESTEGKGTTFYVQIPKSGMRAHAGDRKLS